MEDKRFSVLLVEDNKADARLVEVLLTEAGRGAFSLKNAASLSQALGLLAATPFDAILLDLGLPDSAGLETYATIFNRAPETPIIILTGLEDEALALKAVHGGAQDYLSKSRLDGEPLSRSIKYAIERRRIETELRASEAQYRTMIDAMDDLIAVVGEDSRFVMSNFAFKRWNQAAGLGSALAGKPLSPQECFLTPAFIDACRRALAEGKTLVSEERFKFGVREGVIECRAIPVIEGGRARRIVIALRDITERKKIEQLKGDLIRMTSHDLRTPLAAISGSLSLVAREAPELSQMGRRGLVIAQRNIDRAARLLEDFLYAEKSDSGEMTLDLKPLEVTPFLEQCLEINQPYCEGTGVRFELAQTEPGAAILADALRLSQVMANLLSNAAKFAPAGSAVTVAASRQGRFLRISVSDRGPGVPEHFRRRLFQRFAQASGQKVLAARGSGLGLSIAKDIVEAHQGVIGFDSTAGEKTTFYFELPELIVPAAPPRHDAPAAKP